MQQSTTLPGDVLLITAFISYVGCFTKHYRQELLHKIWTPFVKTLDVRICTVLIEIKRFREIKNQKKKKSINEINIV